MKREALGYCEEIGQTLIRQGNTSYIQLVDLQLFLLVFNLLFRFNYIMSIDLRLQRNLEHLIEIFNLIQHHIENRHG